MGFFFYETTAIKSISGDSARELEQPSSFAVKMILGTCVYDYIECLKRQVLILYLFSSCFSPSCLFIAWCTSFTVSLNKSPHILHLLNLADSGWLWLILADSGWLWLTPTDCGGQPESARVSQSHQKSSSRSESARVSQILPESAGVLDTFWVLAGFLGPLGAPREYVFGKTGAK